MANRVTDFPFWVLGIFIFFIGLSMFWWFTWLVGLFTMVAGVMIIAFYYMFAPKYPTTCHIILDRAGEGRKLLIDKGGRLKNEDGTFYYRFKKLKDETTPITYDLLYQTSKGEVAYFYSPAAGQYLPMDIKKQINKVKFTQKVPDPSYKPTFVPDPRNPGFYIPDPANPVPFIERVAEKEVPNYFFDIIPEDQKEWLVLKQTRQKQKYQTMSAWEKFYPLIVVAIMGVVLVIIISGVFNSLNPFIKELTEATRTLAAASQSNAEVVRELARRFPINATNYTGELPVPPDVVP